MDRTTLANIAPLLLLTVLSGPVKGGDADAPASGEKTVSTPETQSPTTKASGTDIVPSLDSKNAYDPWRFCPPIAQPGQPTDLDTSLASGSTLVTAQEAVAESETRTRLSGNVVVQRDTTILQGQNAEYDKVHDRLSLEGKVVYRNGTTLIQGDNALMDLGQSSGRIDNAQIVLPKVHGIGRADSLSIEDPLHATLTGVHYSTCPPGNEDWSLRASKLSLDRESNTGEAYNAVLTFMNVPFFYSPYLNFPLEGRKTGLLPPIYRNSSKNGTDLSLPFYWNIAPNQDATITARNMTERGSMMMTEYRFITENTAGQLNGDYLKDDKKYGDNRSYFAGKFAARISEGWRSDLLYQRVSDIEYLDDLGGSQESSSQTHLERHATLNYRDEYWNFTGKVQDYQTLGGNEPYQRLPQLTLSGQNSHRINRPRLSLQSEAVAFRHDTLVPTGDRVDIKPALSLPLAGASWYLTPKAAWRYTEYRLDNYSQGDHFLRSMPISTIDGGLFFDRELSLWDTPYIQTLEPRLFYLNVPYHNQSAIPLFDTSYNDFNFSQMFSDNRFSGADRQGDANQLTAALTTRFIDDASGKERFRAAIGQITYFQDREVTLYDTDPVETDTVSNLIGELGFTPNDAWNFSITDEWNPNQQVNERLGARLRYSPGQRRVIGLGYRFNRNTAQRQSDAVMLWPLATHWRMIGRWNYDLENEMTLDSIGGLEYESCCWTVRMIARASRNTILDELDHSYMVNLELKGLGTLGQRLEDAVGSDILGIE